MAETLQLRVSEEKYLKTLDDLQSRIDQLRGIQSKLETARTTLERAYKGNEVANLINTVKNYEQRTKEAIEDVTKKREKISAYIQGQQRVGESATNSFNSELQKSSQPFGS